MGLFSRKSNVLYFPGCIAYFDKKEYFEIWKEIFSRLGIDFKVIDKKICCGLPAFEAGYDAEARKLLRRNFEILKEEKIHSIIAPCPLCYKMFLIDYKNMLPGWDIEVKNIWKILIEKLNEKHGLIKKSAREGNTNEIGFQDSCYLGRYSGEYESPREILEILGYKIKELKDNRENAMCSGSCGGLMRSNPELADLSAKEKLLQFKRAGIKKIVVCSLEEYELLKRNSSLFNIEVIEFSNALADGLGIRKSPEEDSNPIVKPEAEINGGELV